MVEVDEKENNCISEVDNILKHGNPVDFFVKTISTMHLGDDWIKKALLLAAFSHYVQRPNNLIHILVSGKSERGKSSVVQSLLECLPCDVYEVWSGFSEKYLFYACGDNEKILSNKILYVDDDVFVDSAFVRNIKTPDEAGVVQYGTVKDQKPLDLVIDGTPVVFESKVNSHIDTQDKTRSLVVIIDESEEHRRKVRDFIIDKECSNGKKVDNKQDIIICRGICKDLTRLGKKKVIIPSYLKEKIPDGVYGRSLKRFIGFIRCSCFINQFQRETKDGGIVANEKDLEVPLEIYANSLGSEILGLDNLDVKILEGIQGLKSADYDKIAVIIKRCRGTAWSRSKNLAEKGLVYITEENRKDFVNVNEKGREALKLLNKLKITGKKARDVDSEEVFPA